MILGGRHKCITPKFVGIQWFLVKQTNITNLGVLVCRSMLGISKSNISTTWLELENIMLFSLHFLGFQCPITGGSRSHDISNHLYSE